MADVEMEPPDGIDTPPGLSPVPPGIATGLPMAVEKGAGKGAKGSKAMMHAEHQASLQGRPDADGPAGDDDQSSDEEDIPTAPPPPPEELVPLTSDDRIVNAKFKELVEHTVEDAAASNHRERVLADLGTVVKTWVKLQLRKNAQAEQGAQLAQPPDDRGARVLTFGSYALGVHFPKADIDALCIAPRDISSDDFFGTLVSVLQNHPQVEHLNPVREAHVPVIKFQFQGVQIDLVFAALDMDRIPPEGEFDLLCDSLPRNLDDAAQRSLNGARVARKLLQLVPNKTNFQLALRGVKLWAKNRGIYGNIYGFPGGVAWAIMMARVCQVWPDAGPATLMQGFFSYYQGLIEDKENDPIFLTSTLEVADDPGEKSWTRRKNRGDLFPIITPMFPYMNSCYNVSRPNLAVIINELQRAKAAISKQVEAGVKPEDFSFNEVWETSDFFTQYKIYLQIEVGASNPRDFHRWSELVESKVRHFVAGLGPQSRRQQQLEQYDSDQESPTVPNNRDGQLELRLWPFMFRSGSDERLYFDKETARRAIQEDNRSAESIPQGKKASEKHQEEKARAAAAAAEAAVAAAAAAEEVARDEGGGSGSDSHGSDGEGGSVALFFIGVDALDPAVRSGERRQLFTFDDAIEHLRHVCSFQQRAESMADPVVSLVRRKDLPDWVLSPSDRAFLADRAEKVRLRRELHIQRRADFRRRLEADAAAGDSEAIAALAELNAAAEAAAEAALLAAAGELPGSEMPTEHYGMDGEPGPGKGAAGSSSGPPTPVSSAPRTPVTPGAQQAGAFPGAAPGGTPTAGQPPRSGSPQPQPDPGRPEPPPAKRRRASPPNASPSPRGSPSPGPHPAPGSPQPLPLSGPGTGRPEPPAAKRRRASP